MSIKTIADLQPAPRNANQGTPRGHDIIDLADKAVRCVLGGRQHWTPEDWDDARQEAALNAWCASGIGKGEGYVFNAARAGVYDWMRMWIRGHPRAGTILDYIAYPDDSGASVREYAIDFDHLACMLQAQQAQHVNQDVQYLQLVLAGYSTDGIALEMGLSRRNVYTIRERTVPRLRRIASGAPPLDRGAAISAAKARKRVVQ